MKISPSTQGVLSYFLIVFLLILSSISPLTSSETNVITPHIIPDTVHDVKGKVVAFIGDSHTSYSKGWQDMLSKKTGLSYFNYSVGGISTGWMLDIAKSNLNSNHNFLFVWGGANDMFGNYISPRQAFKNVQEIVNLANKKNIKTFILTGFSPKDCVENKNQKIEQYIKRYSEYQQLLVDSIKGATVIKNHFVSKSDGDCGDYICHMTYKGHTKMADSIISTLKLKLVDNR
jgi:ABC-type Zn uptake system ZnuABC Zn-binding protein ZnuA